MKLVDLISLLGLLHWNRAIANGGVTEVKRMRYQGIQPAILHYFLIEIPGFNILSTSLSWVKGYFCAVQA